MYIYVCMHICICIDSTGLLAAYNIALLLLHLIFTTFVQAIIKRDVLCEHTSQARPL